MTNRNLNNLTAKRKSINEIDKEILKLLSKRQNLAKEIGKLKKRLNMPVSDKKREKEVLNKTSKKTKKLGLNKKFVKEIFKAIFKNSRVLQGQPKSKI